MEIPRGIYSSENIEIFRINCNYTIINHITVNKIYFRDILISVQPFWNIYFFFHHTMCKSTCDALSFNRQPKVITQIR